MRRRKPSAFKPAICTCCCLTKRLIVASMVIKVSSRNKLEKERPSGEPASHDQRKSRARHVFESPSIARSHLAKWRQAPFPAKACCCYLFSIRADGLDKEATAQKFPVIHKHIRFFVIRQRLIVASRMIDEFWLTNGS